MQLITILGQTASGKTQLSLDWYHYLLAKNKSAIIVNCDSRQIYKGLNHGTAKIEGDWVDGIYTVIDRTQKIPHYLIDYIEPSRQYTLADYLKDFTELLNSWDGNKPDYVILVGGTGLYAKAINEQLDLGLIKPQFQKNFDNLKQKYNTLNIAELQELINSSQIKLNNSDYHNPIRLVSSLVRSQAITEAWLEPIDYPLFEQRYYYAINVPDQNLLKTRIRERILTRINQGLVNETKKLMGELTPKRIMELGLEYSLTMKMLSGELSEQQWLEQLVTENFQYAKRQLTWLKKQKNLIWIDRIIE